MNRPFPVVVLIATSPRIDLLRIRALPSLAMQKAQPDEVVIVSDKRDLSLEEQVLVNTCIEGLPIKFLRNSLSAGVAGSWNTGAKYIREKYEEAYISIIDDDDEWSPCHILSCLRESNFGLNDVILSGLSVVKHGVVLAENIPLNISPSDFLVGNPGWQGSNTFIKSSTYYSAGGFTNGLVSCNDRDFAIKVLDLEGVLIGYTYTITVQWFVSEQSDALSAYGSRQKLLGAAKFLNTYRDRMTEEQLQQFYFRMQNFFGLKKTAIEQEISLIM